MYYQTIMDEIDEAVSQIEPGIPLRVISPLKNNVVNFLYTSFSLDNQPVDQMRTVVTKWTELLEQMALNDSLRHTGLMSYRLDKKISDQYLCILFGHTGTIELTDCTTVQFRWWSGDHFREHKHGKLVLKMLSENKFKDTDLDNICYHTIDHLANTIPVFWKTLNNQQKYQLADNIISELAYRRRFGTAERPPDKRTPPMVITEWFPDLKPAILMLEQLNINFDATNFMSVMDAYTGTSPQPSIVYPDIS